MTTHDPKRFRVGMVVPGHTLVSISGERLRIPDARSLVHLQFRRFAGCPVCNLHLQSFVRRHEEILDAGMREVVLFHSSPEELRKYAGDMPFAVVADPQKKLYREFGVESSVRALLHPRAILPIVRAVAHSARAMLREGRPMPPLLAPEGGRFGLPADFLVDRAGVVRACRYGVHADDHWSVDELLALTIEHHLIDEQAS